MFHHKPESPHDMRRTLFLCDYFWFHCHFAFLPWTTPNKWSHFGSTIRRIHRLYFWGNPLSRSRQFRRKGCPTPASDYSSILHSRDRPHWRDMSLRRVVLNFGVTRNSGPTLSWLIGIGQISQWSRNRWLNCDSNCDSPCL